MEPEGTTRKYSSPRPRRHHSLIIPESLRDHTILYGPPPRFGPVFRIGGKMDPGRFTSSTQKLYYVGIHEEERSEFDFPSCPSGNNLHNNHHGKNNSAPSTRPSHRFSLCVSNPSSSSMGSGARPTLSPVREHFAEEPRVL
ncbi:unnamed protein product [Lepeophtheirus salmonis]|uniref:(salmon louse) hypothetical protein n=1 Tax=Lepeophtheirus salmonis TaxID=72036 RepID=A0A7R8D4N5_LEPSM|nr:unnamed protein product [Lepeophtheirus salmonis]CAF3023431.1 unnamed protein product [Lepeophtheirus salmonis]